MEERFGRLEALRKLTYSDLQMNRKRKAAPRSGPGSRAISELEFVAALGSWRALPGPVYQRLARAVILAVYAGGIPVGTRVPAERALADHLKVSRTTIVAAYALLRIQSWLTSRHGSGSWLCVPTGADGSDGSGAPATCSHQRLFRMLSVVPDAIDLRCAAPIDLGVLSKRLLSFDAGAISSKVAPGYIPHGRSELRRAIAEDITALGVPTREEQILVTGGAQQAICLIASLYLQPGDTVIVEEPTNVGAIDAFHGVAARVIPVPIGKDGIRVEALRQTIESERPRLITLVPSFHNPTGALLSETARRKIARLCDEFGIPLLENNAVGDVWLDAKPPPPIAAFSETAPILLVGSLSKLVWAGLRIGWVRASEDLIARLTALKTIADYGSSVLSQAAANNFFRDAEDFRHIRRAEIKERRACLWHELDRQLPSWTYERTSGGLSVWVRLPFGVGAEFAQVAMRHGVSFLSGDVFSVSGGFKDHIRLPYVQEPKDLREAVSRLARAWDEYTVQRAPAKRPLQAIG